MIEELIDITFNVFFLLFLVYILASWLPSLRQYSLVQQIEHLFDRLLSPIRQVIKPIQLGNGMSIDLSPLVLILLFDFLRGLIANIL